MADDTPGDRNDDREQGGRDDERLESGASPERPEKDQPGTVPDAGHRHARDKESDDDRIAGLVTRRQLLGSGLAAGGLGLAGYLLMGDSVDTPTSAPATSTPTSTPTPAPREIPFDVWTALRAGLRKSPDHLPATADRLVSEGEPKAIYEFVRDDVGLQPATVDSDGKFRTQVYGGPRATLRAGVGTPREKAELLAWLLRRAGYEASVVRYKRGLGTERRKELYFGGPVHQFDPGFDRNQLDAWASKMRGSAEDAEGYTLVDEGGKASAALAEQVRTALPDSANRSSTGFKYKSWRKGVPIVRFREASDGSTGTETADSESTPTGTVDPSNWRYADLFHADESFGSVTKPKKLGKIDPVSTQEVTVTLETARMDKPTERIELVSGGWDATELAGRQLFLDTIPGKSLVDSPTVTFDEISTFVPALSVRDPHTPTPKRRELSRVGDPFSLIGDRYTIDATGKLRKNQTVMDEGDTEWNLVVEAPDGTETTVTPIEDERSVKKYFSYSDEQGASSYTPDKLEKKRTTITFLYRDTSRGDLSLVVLHDHPTEGDGGRAVLRFDGVRGYRWLIQDDPPDSDSYETPDGPFTGAEEAKWGWNPAHTDGGVIGRLAMPFDIDITHFANGGEQFNGTRKGLDRWVFLSGESPDDPVDLVEFAENAENAQDQTINIRAEKVEEKTPTPTRTPDSGSQVEDIEVSVATGSYPEIRVTVEATDGDGVPVTELPGSAFTMTENDEPVAAQLTPSEGSGYTFRYRTPHRGENVPDERTVSVTLRNDSAGASATYTVPATSSDPRTERGLCGLYLRMTVGEQTIRRTLAGWDPELDGDREPDESDYEEVFSALWGGHALSFETAGVRQSVLLDDELSGKLTLKALDEARATGEVKKMRQASRDGHGLTTQLAAPFQPRLPDRFTEDSITYSTGLRTVLVGERPVFGEGAIIREVDVLPTASIRTLTADGDREREFRLTMERSARRSVMEREAFGTSTAAKLAGTTLTTVANAKSAMSADVKQQLQVATARRPASENSFRLTAQSGETAAYWQVDAKTGAFLGVLPDGSGGASGKGIIKQLEKINRTVKAIDTASEWYQTLSGPPDAEAAVAKAYGEYLVRLYAIAATSVATLSMESYSNAVAAAISKRVCNIASTIVAQRGFPPSAQSDIAEFMNNIPNAKDHTSSTCQQNDVGS